MNLTLLEKVISLKELGLRWCLYRGWLKVAQILRLYRLKMPVGRWTDESGFRSFLESAGARRGNVQRFFLKVREREWFRSQFGDSIREQVRNRGDKCLKGEWLFFSGKEIKVGFPPDWHKNPLSYYIYPSDTHWSEIATFAGGDIKGAWELSRFGVTYDLVRAYWITEDEKYAEGFWTLVEDWSSKNQPNCGVNWICGQEASFRLMAWLFGFHGFIDASATSNKRLGLMTELLIASGRRIEHHLGYAKSQKNNHWISEAIGLWSCGVMLPEFAASERWRTRGLRELKEGLTALVYDDGSFSQHSMNYHRLLLHDLEWLVALSISSGERLDTDLKNRIRLVNGWMRNMILGGNGETPMYGANDGALVFPVSECDYCDFRPVVQSMSVLLDGKPAFPSGAWNEETFWFGGAMACSIAQAGGLSQFEDLVAKHGGYYVMKTETSAVLVRCPEFFRHRMGHADLLHVDLWWKGMNIAIDPGTYSYNAAPPWGDGFVSTRYHNTVSVAGQDQANRVSRFLLLPTPRGRCRFNENSSNASVGYWEGEHDGYTRINGLKAVHRRGVGRLGQECWIVMDRVVGDHGLDWEVNWTFPDMPFEVVDTEAGSRGLRIETAKGEYQVRWFGLGRNDYFEWVQGEAGSMRGWRSRYYGVMEKALSIRLKISQASTVVTTVFSPGDTLISSQEEFVLLEGRRWKASVHRSMERDDEGLLAKMLRYERDGRTEELDLSR